LSTPDIDVDVASTVNGIDIFPEWIRASNLLQNNLVAHPVGIYCQNIPIDPISEFAAIPYKQAEELGYFKLDFLHLKIYDHFESKEQIDELLNHEPEWALLRSPAVVKQLFQLGSHFDILNKVQPKSINDIADCIALIRPGKIHLLDKYLESKDYWRKVLYEQKEGDQYNYKKSHAIAYAHVIVLQLHLIAAGIDFS
jgi:DNA polymerase III alpha subunit